MLFNLAAPIVFLLMILVFVWKFIFLRDPEREIPEGKNIVSPADGRIIAIRKVKGEVTVPKKHLGRIKTLCSDVAPDCVLVSIFMSPMNVHVNRSPISCRVISVKHSPGKFLSANSLKAGIENEKSEVLIKTSLGNMKVIQVAGLIARRIETWISSGKPLKKGERIGQILLGSQVILIMPDKVKILVSEGDKVKAGETIIASY